MPRIPGTPLALDPPEGFVPAVGFTGFQDEAAGAFVMVTELPGTPLADVVAGLTGHGPAAVRLEAQDQQSVEVAGVRSLLLTTTEEAGGGRLHRQVLVTGSAAETLLVVAGCPAGAPHRLRVQLREALLSIEWVHAPVDVCEGLPFRIEVPEGFGDVRRMEGTLLLAESGVSPDEPGRAVLVVGRGAGRIERAALPPFAEARARQMATLTDFEGFSGSTIHVAGAPAYELTARARDADSAAPIALYQVIAPEGDGYALIVGMVGADRADAFQPVFQQVVQTFEHR